MLGKIGWAVGSSNTLWFASVWQPTQDVVTSGSRGWLAAGARPLKQLTQARRREWVLPPVAASLGEQWCVQVNHYALDSDLDPTLPDSPLPLKSR